jgi:hypothetical protein
LGAGGRRFESCYPDYRKSFAYARDFFLVPLTQRSPSVILLTAGYLFLFLNPNLSRKTANSLFDVLERIRLLPQRRKDAKKKYLFVSPFPGHAD